VNQEELTKYGVKTIDLRFSTTPMGERFIFNLEFYGGEMTTMEFDNIHPHKKYHENEVSLYIEIFAMRNNILNKHCLL
jgi:hypothetical protein